MASQLRDTGISVVGDMPWGTHFCSFYETKQDLLDILIPFFRTGLESTEFCLWIVSNSELLTMPEARNALLAVLPNLDRYIAKKSLEFVGHDWFLNGGAFDFRRVGNQFKQKADEALARGYVGMRVNASPAWLEKSDPNALLEFEEHVNRMYSHERIIASCTYPIGSTTADFLLDIARRHQFAIARRNGIWDIVETPELTQAKAEIERLNAELEQRVIERTKKLEETTATLRAEIEERKEAEEALRQSKARFTAFMDNLPGYAWMKDLQGRYVYANHAVKGLPGYQSLGKTDAQIWPVDRAADYRANDQQVIAAKKPLHTFEHFVLGGKERYMAGTKFPIFDKTGAVALVGGTGVDITERVEAEAAVRRSEEHLRLVIDTIPVMAWTVRPDGVVDFLNQRWLDYAGLSLEEYVNDPTGPIHPEDVPRVIEKWRTRMAAGKSYETEMRLRRADGEYRWFLVRTEPLRDEQGTIVKWYGVSTDIEDRKRAELEARTLINAIPDQIWSGPPDGTCDYVNDRWHAETGLTPEEMRGDGWQTLLHPDDRERVLKAWQYSVETGTPFEQEERRRTADGTYRWYLNRGVPLRDDEGRIIRWYGTNTDIEDRKRAEEKVKQTSEQLRALSARLQTAKEEESKRIARELHDELGGALTSWRWDLEEIRDSISESADLTQVAALQTKIEAMIKLTETTLDTVRRITSELRPMALELGLKEAIEWQALQFENRTSIDVRLDLSVDKVDLDNGQATAVFRILQEALTNILRHAQPTRVAITVTEASGQFILTIKDNGRGISDIEKLSPQSLGLLGMRERAHLAGGEIEIESAEGEGTEITVRVPLSASQLVRSVPQIDS